MNKNIRWKLKNWRWKIGSKVRGFFFPSLFEGRVEVLKKALGDFYLWEIRGGLGCGSFMVVAAPLDVIYYSENYFFWNKKEVEKRAALKLLQLGN